MKNTQNSKFEMDFKGRTSLLFALAWLERKINIGNNARLLIINCFGIDSEMLVEEHSQDFINV